MRLLLAAPLPAPQVPFIAQYRKEVCGELLAVRSSDEPRTAEERVGATPAGVIRVSGWEGRGGVGVVLLM